MLYQLPFLPDAADQGTLSVYEYQLKDSRLHSKKGNGLFRKAANFLSNRVTDGSPVARLVHIQKTPPFWHRGDLSQKCPVQSILTYSPKEGYPSVTLFDKNFAYTVEKPALFLRV